MNNNILIISHNPFSKRTNNGKTLEAIFSKFNKNELIQLYFVEDEWIDEGYASSYFKMLDKDVLNSFLPKKNKNSIVSTKQSQIVKSSKLKQLLVDKKHTFAFFRDILWKIAKPYKNKKLNEWIIKYNPDYVFFVGGNQVFAHEITKVLTKKYNLKYGVFFTDDYLLYPHADSLVKKIHYKKLLRAYRETISNASICFSIGDLMSSEYEKAFGKKFHPIMNMVEMPKIEPYAPNNDKFTISYFGGFHLNRWKMLVEFSREVDHNKIEFNVYSSYKLTEEISNLFKENNINFKGYLSGADLELAMVSSDALIHVESTDIVNKSLTKLSVSTKIPEYLNTGKLIIGYGPDDVASMKLLAENNIGIVINKKEKIKEILQSIINNTIMLDDYSQRAKKFVKLNFDIEKNSTNFKELIEKEMLKL